MTDRQLAGRRRAQLDIDREVTASRAGIEAMDGNRVGSPDEEPACAADQDILPGAFMVELDRQGRVLLPAPLREAAELEGRAIVVGCGDYVELWSPERWEL